MILSDALNEAIETLSLASIQDPIRDARVLMRDAIEEENGPLDTQLILSKSQLTRFRRSISQRAKNQPVSQILGFREFWGRRFEVSQDTLDPRPDTELLIELALKIRPVPSSILDLGTGTSCILSTLLSEWPECRGVGTDVNLKTLKVAQRNIDKLGLSNRAVLKSSHWFADVEGSYDLIVSNPPYISEDDLQTIAPDVLNWEPKIALSPGGDGLDPYREIFKNAHHHLNDSGIVLVEIGYNQGQAVKELAHTSKFSDTNLHQDLNGKDRAVIAHLCC